MRIRNISSNILAILCSCLVVVSLLALAPGSINAISDLYEPDNTLDTATPISTDGTVQHHSIYPAGDVDYISFSAISGVSYVIETSNLANGCDTYIYLYDKNGKTIIEENDDAGEGMLTSMIEWTPALSGIYYIKVLHYKDIGTGSYGIKVSNYVTDEYELDNIPDTASEISTDGIGQNHNIYPAGDIDYISFPAISGVTYIIETSNLSDICDTNMYLYDKDGATIIEENDDAGEGVLTSMIAWTPVLSGTYYIEVSHYDDTGIGSYDIMVRTYAPDAYEPDGIPDTASEISTDGTVQSHNVDLPGDIDYISFSAISGSTYIIETFNLANGCDTHICLYDTDGTTISAEDNDSGDGFASRIEWTAVLSGTYYIKVSNYYITGFGSYDINVHISRPIADFSATPISGDEPLTVNFTDLSISYDDLALWLWDFDNDGTIDDTSQNPTHDYIQDGNYTISLTVYDIDGDSDTAKAVINIADTSPSAAFTATPTSGDEPLVVSFTDTSTSNDTITSWLWDFGDGRTSNEQHPSHEYTQDGTYTVYLTVYDIDGDSDTATDVINVADTSPSAAFTATPTSGDEPLVVSFTDTSTSNDTITSWLWDFGDGQTSSEQHPSHEYTQDNIYIVTLTVTDSDGNSDSETQMNYITVDDTGPTADFSATHVFGNEPRTLNFINLSTSYDGPVTSWLWDFGDDMTSTEQNPSHKYAQDGIYTVSLTIIDSDGDSDTTIADIYVAATGIYAGFSSTPTSGYEPLIVNFTDHSISYDSAIISWLWDFGDNMTSTEQNPSHEYNQDGTYSVSLIVNNASGSNMEIKADYITVYDTAPLSSFNVSPTSGSWDEPATVQFTDTSTSNDPIISWLWDFGDDMTSTEQNPSHEYNQDGTYAVSLIVYDIDGDSDTATAEITVTDTVPSAAFTANFTSGNAPLLVSFTDTSTSNDPITSWLWDFGDGQTSSEQNPSHEYNNDGVYTVFLIVYDINGDSDTATAEITVTDTVPSAAFTALPISGDQPLPVSFTDTSTSDDTIIFWLWDFGDGRTSTEQNPSHEYNQDGTYTVSLTVYDIDGDSDIATAEITVTDTIPSAAFTAKFTSGNAPLLVSFTDTSTSNDSITSWLWDFGDGQTSSEQNPSHGYEHVGVYTVSLTVTDADGSSDMETNINYVVVGRILAQQATSTDNPATIKSEGDQIIIEFPVRSVTDDTVVTIIEESQYILPNFPSGFKAGATCFNVDLTADLMPEAIITVTVKYSNLDLEACDGNTNKLTLSRYDENTGEWIIMSTVVDTDAMTLATEADEIEGSWVVMIDDSTTESAGASSLWVLLIAAFGGLGVLLVVGSTITIKRRRKAKV